MLYEYLIEDYKPNESIFTSDIELGLSASYYLLKVNVVKSGLTCNYEVDYFIVDKDRSFFFDRIKF